MYLFDIGIVSPKTVRNDGPPLSLPGTVKTHSQPKGVRKFVQYFNTGSIPILGSAVVYARKHLVLSMSG